jgi:hypothetical protein
MKQKPIDPALWTSCRAFGAAGGPDEITLTAEGRARAFSFGAQVRRGPTAGALEALHDAGGEGVLIEHDGPRCILTVLGKYDMTAWTILKSLGYVEAFDRDGVRLTEAGKWACRNGFDERERLLTRCKVAAGERDVLKSNLPGERQ